MVLPRAFSSARPSVSTPVRARTSAALTWAICPAVPTIIVRAAPSSVTDPERAQAARSTLDHPHHLIKPKAGNIVRHRLKRGVTVLIKDLDPAFTLATDLGLDGRLVRLDRAIRDALGRTAAKAGHPHLVPQRLARRARTIARALGTDILGHHA